MASLKDLYDPSVIAHIVGEQVEEAKSKNKTAEKAEDKADLRLYPDAPFHEKYEADKRWQPFSKVFHKPKTIPDIPVKVFKRDDWPEEARMYIPAKDSKWVWNREVLEQLALAFYSKDTTLLFGFQGTGKSCAIEQFCAYCVIPFWRMNCNRETREQHFLGGPEVKYDDDGKMYIEQAATVLTESLRYGGVFCEDETFRHNSALVLQSLREKTNRSVVLPDAPGRTAEERKLTAPEDWWYMLTDNTKGNGDESGIFDAEVQDASTTDRIDTAIEVPYLAKDDEIDMLIGHTGIAKSEASKFVAFANEVRKAFKKGHMMNTMSVRGLLSWGEKVCILHDKNLALRMCFFNRLLEDDQKQVRDIYHMVFGDKL